jgi:hypothetical protein
MTAAFEGESGLYRQPDGTIAPPEVRATWPVWRVQCRQCDGTGWYEDRLDREGCGQGGRCGCDGGYRSVAMPPGISP